MHRIPDTSSSRWRPERHEENHALLARVSGAGMGKDGCHDRVVARGSAVCVRPLALWRPVTSPGWPGRDSDAFSSSPTSPTCRCVPRRGFHPRSACNGVNMSRASHCRGIGDPSGPFSTMTTLQRVPCPAGHCHGVGAIRSGTPEINLALAALELWLQASALGTDRIAHPTPAPGKTRREAPWKDTVVDADVTPAGRSHLPWPEGAWREQI